MSNESEWPDAPTSCTFEVESDRCPGTVEVDADLCADLDEELDARLKAELGVGATEKLMLVLRLPGDSYCVQAVAALIANDLDCPLVIIDTDRKVLAFERPAGCVRKVH